MKFNFTDAVKVTSPRLTEDGYLVAEARAVRTGIQLYHGSEVGMKDKDTVRIYRSPEEVFADESLQSFTHAPITVNHPKDNVTAENWKDLAVGEVSTMAKKDGEWVHLPLILKDAKAIKAVSDGKRELSAGYSCELDWTPGQTADGEKYDGQQKNIRINHLAVVDTARAGSKARIGDDAGDKWGASPFIHQQQEVHMNLRNVLVDGLSVETTDAGAQAISKLQNDLLGLATKLKDAETAHVALFTDLKKSHETALAAKDAIIATKDKELAAKDAVIDDAKKKILSDADLDKRVAARADLVMVAKTIAKDVKTEGLSDSAIRKAVVVAVLGDEAIKDKAEAYIDARFDILVEDAKKNDGNGGNNSNGGGNQSNTNDAFRNLRQGGVQSVADADKALAEYNKSQSEAWKTPKAA